MRDLTTRRLAGPVESKPVCPPNKCADPGVVPHPGRLKFGKVPSPKLFWVIPQPLGEARDHGINGSPCPPGPRCSASRSGPACNNHPSPPSERDCLVTGAAAKSVFRLPRCIPPYPEARLSVQKGEGREMRHGTRLLGYRDGSLLQPELGEFPGHRIGPDSGLAVPIGGSGRWWTKAFPGLWGPGKGGGR